MTTTCSTCMSWVLLASYAVLLGVGGTGVWLSVTNFGGYEEPLPPTPPPKSTITTTTTTTTPNPYGNNYYSRNNNNQPDATEEYKQYVYASRFYATATHDARLYVLLPCVVSMVVAAMVLSGGIVSRRFFTSTFSVYSSVGLWVLTLTWTIVYQHVVAWESRMKLDFVYWVVGTHVVLLLLLTGQIVLGMWELRRQQAGWPTLNWRSVFTAEALLMTARLTLTVYTMIALAYSQMLHGYRQPNPEEYNNLYEKPAIRIPLVLTFVCWSAACYNTVATMETMLSMLLGKVHNSMTVVSSLLSALCCVTIAVLNSPVIVKKVISPMYISTVTMNFAIGLSVATFLHVIACVGFPTTSRSPPEIITKIFDGLVSGIYSLGSSMSNMTSEQLWRPVPTMKKNSIMFYNLISSIFSVLSIIIITASWNSPMYRAWGSVLVLCANSAILMRTLPPTVMELRFKQADDMSVNQKLIAMVLECIALLVGASAMCALLYYGGEIFGGVINHLFLVFQVFVIIQLVQGKCKFTQSEEVERLSNTTEEVTSEGENDEKDPIELLA